MDVENCDECLVVLLYGKVLCFVFACRVCFVVQGMNLKVYMCGVANLFCGGECVV